MVFGFAFAVFFFHFEFLLHAPRETRTREPPFPSKHGGACEEPLELGRSTIMDNLNLETAKLSQRTIFPH